MSKQQEAPGDLELVREFVNTLDVEPQTEELATPAVLADWLTDRGLAAGPLQASRTDLARARELREALRAVLLTHTDEESPSVGGRTLDRIASRAQIVLRFDERGQAQLVPLASGVTGGLGRLLIIVQQAIADGTWERLKACREHTCEWAFYDHTKNRSGAWCSMAVCGNRAKARNYRERRAETAPRR